MTYELARTEQNVHVAAELMDKLYPAWERMVDEEMLDMMCPFMCLLGQVTGSYSTAINRHPELQDSSMLNAFTSGEKFWINEMNERLENA